MERSRASQQFALLARESLRWYAEAPGHEWCPEAQRLAGDILSLVPLGAAGLPPTGTAPLVFRLATLLRQGGLLWLSSRGAEIAAGIFEDPDYRSEAVRSAAIDYAIMGAGTDMLRVLARFATNIDGPDADALNASLLALYHLRRGRVGLARRILRSPLAFERAITSSMRAEITLLAGYVEVVGKRLNEAMVLLDAVELLDATDPVHRAAASLRLWVAMLLGGVRPSGDIPLQSLEDFPFLAPSFCASWILPRISRDPSSKDIDYTVRLLIAQLRGHHLRATAWAVGAGFAARSGHTDLGAEFRRKSVEAAYLAGIPFKGFGWTLDLSHGFGMSAAGLAGATVALP